MPKELIHTVDGVTGEVKIRDYLKKHLGFSTSLIAKVKYDNVYLNGIAVHMRAMVKNGDQIKVVYPSEDSENIPPISIPLEILYEDDYIIAVDKPINMPIHPSKGNSLPTLANAIKAYFNSPFVFRAVNRLDRDTSGIVLIAKDRLTSAKLSNSMKNGMFKKEYEARIVGVPKDKSGTINAPIDREYEGSIKRVVTENGKQCITEYWVKQMLPDGTCICGASPITGRTHQIRVHLAHIGHPLYADFLYGDRIQGETYYLKCIKLQFPHPETGKILQLSAPGKY